MYPVVRLICLLMVSVLLTPIGFLASAEEDASVFAGEASTDPSDGETDGIALCGGEAPLEHTCETGTHTVGWALILGVNGDATADDYTGVIYSEIVSDNGRVTLSCDVDDGVFVGCGLDVDGAWPTPGMSFDHSCKSTLDTGDELLNGLLYEHDVPGGTSYWECFVIY